MSSRKKTRTSRQEFVAQNRKFIADRLAKGKKTLITYVKDEWGQKKGVVVALDPTHIGWSLVHQEKDTHPMPVSAISLPAVQQLLRKIDKLKIDANDEDDVNLFEAQEDLINLLFRLTKGNASLPPGWVIIQEWDREKGLHNAFKSAYENGGDVSLFFTPGQGLKPQPGDILDGDVKTTILRVRDRVEKFFASPVKPKKAV